MSGYNTIDSVEKAFGIIDFISRQYRPVSGKEIQESCGIDKYATLMSHLATLEKLGIIQETGNLWRMGTMLAEYWDRTVKLKMTEGRKIMDDLKRIGVGE